MPNENSREKFLRSYANIPWTARKEIALVLEDGTGKKQPITWEVAYFEVKNNSPKSAEMLEKLEELGLI